jgi:hypothetical protein
VSLLLASMSISNATPSFDQHTMKAVIIVDHDIYDFGSEKEPEWMPLEDILSSFIEMVHQKRIVAIPVDSDVNNPQEFREYHWEEPIDFYTPWMLAEEDNKIVDITISAWHGLLNAIESRLPKPTDAAQDEVTRSDDVETETYYEEHIEACDIHGYFIKPFLQRARIPKFRYVAPGLRIVSSEELADQPFNNIDLDQIRRPHDKAVYEYKWYPFLFLRADGKLPKSQSQCFGYPWENASEYSTGLYLTSSKTIERADGCNLVLPFPINTQGRARFGDMQPIRNYRSHDGLYQPGRNVVVRNDVLRLELLFKNWTSMVKSGHWDVDENGVAGGIEKFKEADTDAKWNLYWIKRTW